MMERIMLHFTRRAFLALAACAFLGAQPRPAGGDEQQREAYVRAHYTKHEFLVPARDGVRLFTSVYLPKDRSRQYPILLLRTPYTVAPYGTASYRRNLGPGRTDRFVREGFIFAYQDVRGKGHSEGTFVHVRPHIPVKRGPADIDESSDTWDTVDWLVKNIPSNNGRVGMYGISYPGFYAAAGAVEAHPALKATSPQAPVVEWFIGDDFRHNGVLFLAHAFGFFSGFGRPRPEPQTIPADRFDMGTPDGYDFHLRTGPLQNIDEKYFRGKIEFWKELLENDTYNAFWTSRDIRRHMKALKPAMMTVGGWFDAEDVYGPLRLYDAAERQSPGAANTLVMGPWTHGSWSGGDGSRVGSISFHSDTAKFFQEEIEFPFFLHHLKDKGEGAKLPEAYMFETGRNEWHALEAWPPREAEARTLYFHAGGQLRWEPPREAGEAFDEYVSDPNKPVPYSGRIAPGMNGDYMVEDQRFAASRPDVLVYESEPLEQDLRAAGPLKAVLHVSTTGTDSDFVVKLIDVYPGATPDPSPNPRNERLGGYQQLVRGEPFRGKFRHSFEKPEPFTPGRREKVEFELPDVFHTFRRGHRIMVHVQSSWFPLTDRNPQKFMRIHEARKEDFQKATQRVFRGGAAPSAIVLRVLK
jgi:putative CocE/NonD family hydrolase